MEIEPSPPVVAKKLWNIVSIAFYMLRKSLSKSKLIMFDLHLLLKRGKLASKNLRDLMLHHHYSTTLNCASTDVAMSLVYPREYEFSCSNSPVVHYPSRRKHRHHYHRHHDHHHQHHYEDATSPQKVFDILSNYESVEASPMISLSGFGRSPMVRQLRVTDSPFSVKDVDENNTQVDKEAEDFIIKFYKELKQQKKRL